MDFKKLCIENESKAHQIAEIANKAANGICIFHSNGEYEWEIQDQEEREEVWSNVNNAIAEEPCLKII